MVMIVLAHVLRGLAAADLLDDQRPWYDELDTVLYLVHLPIFMVVSGLFLARSAQRPGFLGRRLLLLGYLFVLWTVIQGAVKVAAGGLANNPVTLRDLVSLLWHPESQLWFLPTFATLTIVVTLVAPWRGTYRRLLLVVLAVLSVGLWGVFGTWSGTQGLALLVPFAAGVLLGVDRATPALRRPAAIPVGLVLVVAYLALALLTEPTPPSESFWPRTPESVALGVVATACGTAGILALTAHVHGRLGAGLAVLGRRSLEIFVAHIVFTAGARIVLEQLGVTSLAIQIVLGVSLGLAGPLLLVVASERLGWRWLFAPPQSRRARVAAR